MVNYHDPVTISRDYGGYTFCEASARLTDRSLRQRRSSTPGMLWMVYLCESDCPGTASLHLRALRLLSHDPSLLVGNSLLRFPMSGTSSEGIAPTDGRYGFVAFLSGFIT